MLNSGELIPVDAHRGLCRDAHSNSIINTDRQAYLKVKARKENAKKNQAEISEMKEQIQMLIKRCEKLEKEISQLKGINS